MIKKKIAVLASGRGSNFQKILLYLNSLEAFSHHQKRAWGEIILVLSDKAEAGALAIAKENDIPFAAVLPEDYPDRKAYDKALAEKIEQVDADLIVLAGFMRILSADFLDKFPDKIINIHPSLLPKYPGLHAQEQAFKAGEKFSGCTVHFVDDEVDSGPIIAQTKVDISHCRSAEEVAEVILQKEHQLYPKVVDLFCRGKVRVEGRKVFIDE
ncbi:MAG: phosphoribosylglycinamide formyltransferase [Bacillota bacterium]|jgi:phosphoribosylglycinamide formyltransferase-1